MLQIEQFPSQGKSQTSQGKSQSSKLTDDHNKTAPIINVDLKPLDSEYQIDFIRYEVDENQDDNDEFLGDKLGGAGDGEVNVLIDEQRFDETSSDDNRKRE